MINLSSLVLLLGLLLLVYNIFSGHCTRELNVWTLTHLTNKDVFLLAIVQSIGLTTPAIIGLVLDIWLRLNVLCGARHLAIKIRRLGVIQIRVAHARITDSGTKVAKCGQIAIQASFIVCLSSPCITGRVLIHFSIAVVAFLGCFEAILLLDFLNLLLGQIDCVVQFLIQHLRLFFLLDFFTILHSNVSIILLKLLNSLAQKLNWVFQF